jgi:hypothetical protein
MLVSRLAHSSTLKMEAICSVETTVDFQQTTRRYIPEDRTLRNHRCNNPKSYIIHSWFNKWDRRLSLYNWFMITPVNVISFPLIRRQVLARLFTGSLSSGLFAYSCSRRQQGWISVVCFLDLKLLGVVLDVVCLSGVKREWASPFVDRQEYIKSGSTLAGQRVTVLKQAS